MVGEMGAMDIQMFCSHCGQDLLIDESSAGMTVQCPNCGQNILVQAPLQKPLPAAVAPRAVGMVVENKTDVKKWAAVAGGICFAVVVLLALYARFHVRSETPKTQMESPPQQESQTAEAWVKQGLTYRDAGRTDEAIDAYLQAIKLKQDYEYAWLHLGAAYERVNRRDDEIAAFRQATKLKPDHALAWYVLGRAYCITSQMDPAIAALQQAVKLQPDYADAWFLLGQLDRLVGRTEEANDATQRARRLKPELFASKMPDETDQSAKALSGSTSTPSASEDKASVYKEHATVHVGYTSYAVLGSVWRNHLSDNPLWDQRPDAMFLVVELIVRNDDKKPRAIPPFSLVDEAGAE